MPSMLASEVSLGLTDELLEQRGLEVTKFLVGKCSQTCLVFGEVLHGVGNWSCQWHLTSNGVRSHQLQFPVQFIHVFNQLTFKKPLSAASPSTQVCWASQVHQQCQGF